MNKFVSAEDCMNEPDYVEDCHNQAQSIHKLERRIDIYYTILILFLILVAFFIFLVALFSSFSSAYTLDQETSVCGLLNLTFVDCYGLWTGVDHYLNGTLCPTQNFTCVSNTTILYINQTSNFTIFQDKNCSADLSFQQQADATKIRLAEIEKGASPASCPKDVIATSECDLKVSQAIQTPPVTPSSKTPWYKDPILWVLGAILLFFAYKIYGKKFTQSPAPVPQRPFYPPSNPEVPMEQGGFQ